MAEKLITQKAVVNLSDEIVSAIDSSFHHDTRNICISVVVIILQQKNVCFTPKELNDAVTDIIKSGRMSLEVDQYTNSFTLLRPKP